MKFFFKKKEKNGSKNIYPALTEKTGKFFYAPDPGLFLIIKGKKCGTAAGKQYAPPGIFHFFFQNGKDGIFPENPGSKIIPQRVL